MNCSNCGAPLGDDAKFCGACGTATKKTEPPPQEPAYQQPEYAPPQEPAYQQPEYAPPPQEPAYQQPAYAPPPQEPGYQQPAYAPTPQEPGYQQPAYAPPSEPGYQQPGYAPPPQEPGYQQPAYQQPAYAPPPYGGPPPDAGASKSGKGINLKIIIPVAAAVLLIAVFAVLWFFTGIFNGGTGGGKIDDDDPFDTPTSTVTEPADPTPTPTPAPTPQRPDIREGYYNVVTLMVDGEDMLEQLTDMGADFSNVYLEILSGNRFRLVNFDESTEGSFTISGNTITLTADGEEEELEATFEGNQIILDSEGSILVLEWNPAFVPPPFGGDTPWLDPDLPLLSEGNNSVSGKTYFRFIAPSEGTWEFRTMDSATSDPTLRVYDSSGKEIAFNDDFGSSVDAFLTIDLTMAESIIVEVDFYPGSTTTTLFVSAGGGGFGPVVEGYIPTEGGVVAIRETQTLEFVMDKTGFWTFYTMNSGSDDPYLVLYDQDGDEYTDDDDGMGDYENNALLIVYFDKGEPGSIEAGFKTGDSGYFELVVIPPETISDFGGTFEVLAPRAFVFIPAITDTWFFETSDNDGDPYLQVFDMYGNKYEDDDGAGDLNAMLELELIEGETYHIVATFAGAGPTSYKLIVW